MLRKYYTLPFNNTVDELFSSLLSFDGPLTRPYRDDLKVDKDGTQHLAIEIPGYSSDEIKVTADENYISIEGKKEGRSLSHRFLTPSDADIKNISAKAEYGILTLTVPKQEKKKPREIKVQ